MNYVLNKALKMKKKSEPDLFAPGDPCKCKCKVDCESFHAKVVNKPEKIARFTQKMKHMKF